MHSQFTPSQQAKFFILAGGIDLAPAAVAYLNQACGKRPLTLDDYASTSGICLALEHDVWVNAPIAAHNPNMVSAPRYRLDTLDSALCLVDGETGQQLKARFCPVPAYAVARNEHGEPLTKYVNTHADRARLSPVQGCSMRCKFCDVPFDYRGRYETLPIDRLLAAAAIAIADPVQPAAHFLISGGTPAPRDFGYLREVYRQVLAGLIGTPVDIMMTPTPGILDLDELAAVGVNELSLNLEIWDEAIAQRLIPEKNRHGKSDNLDFIAAAVDRLGRNRVRSILMVGLEDPASTLAGVEALAALGCVPVLSPFRPDPTTELASVAPPTAQTMMRVFLDASDIAARHGLKLGPHCIPCTHNTLTLADGSGDYHYHHRRPNLV